MRCEAKIKELLIENAIHLIAEGGFEKATTKELAHCGGHSREGNRKLFEGIVSEMTPSLRIVILTDSISSTHDMATYLKETVKVS